MANEAAAAGPGLPARTAVVLLHGLCSTPDELLSINAPLREVGCTVVPLRIAGYSFDAGRSAAPARPFEAWVVAVHASVRALRITHDKVVLAGISAGSGLALASAMDPGVRVDGLVLMSTTLRYDGWAIPPWHFLLHLAFHTPLGRLWQYRERPPYGVKNERIRVWIARELENRRVSSAGSATIGVSYLKQHDRLIRHVRHNMGRVHCPEVLAIHAEEDEVASPRNLELLASGLASTAARLQTLIVSNSYHMVSIDNDRHQVAREAVAFVRAIIRSA